jgi:threonine/homoserine/homoserine lactone efflux protein
VVSLGLTGFVLGFAIAASPGPIFFLCLRRTLTRGWLSGLVSGLGVATADGVYGALAAFGVAVASAALVTQRRWLTLAGGILLVVLGLRGLLARRTDADRGSESATSGLGWTYVSTFGLTIANPATIISFGAVFAALGVGIAGGYLRPAVLVGGVLLGSAAWWLGLVSAVAAIRTRVTPGVVRAIRIVSGVAIVAFGVVAIVSAIGGRWLSGAEPVDEAAQPNSVLVVVAVGVSDDLVHPRPRIIGRNGRREVGVLESRNAHNDLVIGGGECPPNLIQIPVPVQPIDMRVQLVQAERFVPVPIQANRLVRPPIEGREQDPVPGVQVRQVVFGRPGVVGPGGHLAVRRSLQSSIQICARVTDSAEQTADGGRRAGLTHTALDPK